MNINNRVDHVIIHLVERFIAQDAGVIDDDINFAKGVNGSLDNGSATVGRRYGIMVCDGIPTASLNFIHHLLRR